VVPSLGHQFRVHIWLLGARIILPGVLPPPQTETP
jgi:hypothetical protein